MNETAVRLYLDWLAKSQPLLYTKVINRVPAASRNAIIDLRARRAGLGALGDTSSLTSI